MTRHDLWTLGGAALMACAIGCSNTAGGSGGSGSGSGGVQASFTSLYQDYFQNCGQCHAPGAPGRTSDTEQSLDFSSRSTAYSTLTGGTATGLSGNQSACNGVPFIGGSSTSSLVMAVLDEDVRQIFDVSSHPGCDVDAISDMTLKVGKQPSQAFLGALGTWIDNGAPND